MLFRSAVQWYRKAALQGHAKAQFNLALCYENGQGVKQDYAEAGKLYQMAAQQGNVNAIRNLARCYRHGRGVEKNNVKAVILSTAALLQHLAR